MRQKQESWLEAQLHEEDLAKLYRPRGTGLRRGVWRW